MLTRGIRLKHFLSLSSSHKYFLDCPGLFVDSVNINTHFGYKSRNKRKGSLSTEQKMLRYQILSVVLEN